MAIKLKSTLKFLLLFIFCSISYLAKSQDSTGTVQFYIYPDTIHILIDSSQRVKASARVVLPAGKHNVLIKGKKLETYNQTINIIKDSTIYIRKIMKYSNDYKRYQSELSKYNFKKTAATITAAGFVLGIYYMSYKYTKSMYDQEKESKDLADEAAYKYNTTQSQANAQYYGDAYRNHKKDYDEARVRKFSAIPVVLIATYLGYKSYGLINKIKKPVYLEPLSLNIGYLPGNYTNYSLTYKF